MDKKYKGKTNIDILRSYVAGERPFVTVGYTGNTNKYRKEGERWTDNKGIEWEKKDGKNVRLTKTQAEMIREMITQKCKCGQVIRWGSKLDQKFYNRTGLCANCLIDYETKLRIVGVYDFYEAYKMLSYELGTLKDAKEKLKEIIKYFTENSGDVEMICNSEGFRETWKNTNKDQILADAKRDLKLARKKITEVTKVKEEAKKKYIEGAAKFQLETYV